MLRIMQYFAFGNEIALTDDFVIVGATRTSAFPHSKQIKSWFALGVERPLCPLCTSPNLGEEFFWGWVNVEFKIQNSKFKILNSLRMIPLVK